MGRSPDKRIEEAKQLYLSGVKLVDIANQLSVSSGTVRSWKTRYDWDGGGNATLQKKSSVAKKKERDVAEEVRHVMENPDLNDKQRLFCLYYIRCFNATKSYQKAYGCSYEVAATRGPTLLGNARIREEITKLKEARYTRELLSEHDIFQKYLDIAFSDITDYVEFGREEVPAMGAFGPIQVNDPETGEKTTLIKTVNSVRFRESSEVDGTLIAEVKQGRDGASIKLPDKLKALEWLADHMNMATEEQKARVAVIKQRLGVAEEERNEDDGFLAALQGTAAEDWKDAEGVENEETSDI